jgi:predicted nucleic acid-binding protein
VAGLTLDAGALIQYERADERVRAWLTEAFERGNIPTVPSVVVAETWRGGPKAARIARLLKDCEVESLDDALARQAGLLRGAVDGSATIDAIVVASASRRGDIVLTTDSDDLGLLAAHAPGVRIEQV